MENLNEREKLWADTFGLLLGTGMNVGVLRQLHGPVRWTYLVLTGVSAYKLAKQIGALAGWEMARKGTKEYEAAAEARRHLDEVLADEKVRARNAKMDAWKVADEADAVRTDAQRRVRGDSGVETVAERHAQETRRRYYGEGRFQGPV